MSEKESDFLKRLLVTFRIEAQEHLDALFAGIGELERIPDETRQAELIETIFREAHSLKGAARSVNMTQIEAACQSLESTFAEMKNQRIVLTTESFDRLHQEINRLGTLLEPEPQVEPKPQIKHGLEERAAAVAETRPEPQISTVLSKAARALPEEGLAVAGTVRISTEKLDSIFLQVEEMLTAKLLAQQRRQELQTLQAMVAEWSKNWSEKVAQHPDFFSTPVKQPQWLELVEQNSAFIKTLSYQLGVMGKTADQDQRMVTKIVDELLDNMKKALMLPFSTLMEVFPRLVRDLARNGGKDIELEIRGGEIEADRRILEEIKDPLIHLLRNCVDHGIELPNERASCDKPLRGKISIVIFPRSGNRVEIDVSDDGAGIDTVKVKAAAARLGIQQQQDAFGSDDDTDVELIYQSGVSTSPIITEVSGRGIGLAIVREKVERLGGGIAVETQQGVGTTFRIELPLTLATYRGVVVRVAMQTFVLPGSHVERSLRIRRDDIRTLENRETIRLGDQTLSLAWLGDVLGIAGQDASDTLLHQVLVLTAGEKRIAFVVDEILGEQEVLVKSLGRQLSRVRNISGATILGSGKVVPILNVSDLLKSALQTAHTGIGRTLESKAETKAPKQAVLVVEDSITARSLLKGILEVAGYKVVTAVDGIDGLTQLRSGEFDIVVSDVDMPRMNGFDLTAKIRSDKKLADLPVILVTALESREDRERGVDVGANAYIVKRSFEQSNLLEVLRRLI
ncbi:hybrid sensor histidine kinase/response regulator [Methylobacter sp.]|uniref:hybrid sensor histidine kinase/response regulator n=1 Tax=Methylobacter sp. TaxID=2051955 RepID=UPI002FDC8142